MTNLVKCILPPKKLFTNLIKPSNKGGHFKYNFEFIYKMIRDWQCDVTIDNLKMLPSTVIFWEGTAFDGGNNLIIDMNDYWRERERYYEYLVNKIKHVTNRV